MPDVVCVGAHVLDVLGGPVDDAPMAGVRTLVEEMKISVAGTAAGVAVDLARHGVATATVGAVGDDVAGRLLVQLMEESGVDVAHVRRDVDVQTSMSMHAIGTDGERRPIHVVGANRLVSPDDVATIAASAPRAVHLGGLDVMPALWPVANQMLGRWKDAGAITTLDVLTGCHDTRLDWSDVLTHVDWFFPNELQLRNVSEYDSPVDGAKWALDQGAAHVVVTLGPEGALMNSCHGLVHIPTRDIVVRDTTGCGDAVVAGMIVALLAGRDAEVALALGVVAGACTARAFGSDAGPAGLEALEEALDALPILLPKRRLA